MKSKALMFILSYEIVKIVLVFLFLGTALSFVNAHQAKFSRPSNYNESIEIEAPTISKSYYAELENFPHTYTLDITEPIDFYAELLVPKSVMEANRTAILVKQEKRGVSEIARLKKTEGPWETFFEPFGGDVYRQGPSIEIRLEPGKYIFEVSTPDNLGKYILVVGQEEELDGFFTTLSDIYQIKKFLDKPGIAVLQSPFYYVPLLALASIILLVWYRRRKQYA